MHGLKTERLRISLLGLAFKGKPETDDLRGSMAFPIHESLNGVFKNSIFIGYDPLIKKDIIESIGLVNSDNLMEVFYKSDISLILNNHPIFSTISLNEVASKMNHDAIIYDFWNHFKSEEYVHLPNNVKYISLGSHIKVNK
jgi:UDP-N-acetyl-D-mannosaminuronic acid dehydrogenase